MAETLKPCPFCGGEASTEHYPGNEDGPPEAWVRCESPDCMVNPSTFGREISDAFADWNRRAEPKRVTEEGSDMWENIQILDYHFDENCDGDLGDAPGYAWESIRRALTVCPPCANECTVCGEQIGPGHQHGEGE